MASIYRRKQGGTFYITYFVRPGKRRTVKGSRDKASTEALARKLESDAMLRANGVIDPKADQYAKAEAKPLMVEDDEGKVVGGHVGEFYDSLLAKGTTAKHAHMVRQRVAKVLTLSKAKHLSDISPSAIQEAIASLRDDRHLSLQSCNHYLRAIKQFAGRS